MSNHQEIDNFNKLQAHEVRNKVSIDFDGVIHKSTKGFKDGGIYDPPIEGTKEALRWFKKQGYRVAIYTAKVNPDRPLVKGKTGKELIDQWLREHGIDQLVDEVTCIKPRALVYIDDRALRFHSWQQALSDFQEIVENERA
jgi:phosphoglycolate phosphatase-like HAD superfamily hydrolase